MVNLLPRKTIHRLHRTYYVRFATTIFALLAGAFAIGGVLMVPSYVVSERTVDSSERYLAAVEETIGVRERAGVSDEMRALAERVRILSEHNNTLSAVPFFEDVAELRTSEVRITGIGFNKGEDAFSISLAGVAATRSALLEYIDRINESGKFEGVSVPVTQLALDADIPFSITATYRSDP